MDAVESGQRTAQRRRPELGANSLEPERLGDSEQAGTDEALALEQGPRDEALAAEAAAGDGRAFELLVRRYGARVLACLERVLGEHHQALDASQEVWLKVHRGLAGFQAERRFRPWLFAIVMNHGRDRLRSRARHEAALVEAHGELLANGPPPGAALFEQAAIAAALSEVPEPFRAALILVDVLGTEYPEAAQILGLPVGTVKSRVHRARLCFRASYEASSGA